MTNSKRHSALFSSKPADGDEGLRYSIVRTPQNGLRGLFITSHDPIGLYTHWTGGRTIPCMGDHCELCDNNTTRRWYGYLMIWNPKMERQYIFEYTASAAVEVVEYYDQHRTLRGARIDAVRAQGRPNGRLSLFLRKPPSESQALPKAPNRVDLLSTMWACNLNDFAPKTKKQDRRTIDKPARP